MIDILLEITGINISTLSTRKFYFSKKGHINDTTGKFYEPAIFSSILIKFSSNTFNDSASIRLVNNGRYDYLNDYSFNATQK